MGLVNFKSATGIFLGEKEVGLTTLARTPTGVREVASVVVAREGRSLTECLQALAAEKRLVGKLVCGINPRRLFLDTQRLTPEEQQEDATELLTTKLPHFKASTVAGKATVRLPAGAMTTLLACSDNSARDAFAGLEGIKHKRLFLTGLPLALYHHACRLKRPSRKAKCEVRIFLGRTEALAVLAWQGAPVAIHLFDGVGPRLVRTIELAVLNLLSRARDTLGLPGIDRVCLHTGEGAKALAQECTDAAGVPTVVAPLVALDARTAAHALATYGLLPPKTAVNLFDVLLPAGGFVKNFPVRAVVLLLGLLVGGRFLTGDELTTLEADAGGLKKKATANAKAVGVSIDDLEDRHELRKGEFKLASYFITDRVFFGEILQELPDLMPESLAMIDINTRDGLHFPRKKESVEAVGEAKRQISLAGTAVMQDGSASPPELAALIEAVKNSETIPAMFPRIINSNVRLMPGVRETLARILITCAP